MDGPSIGLIGGILGGVIGVTGGAVGTYFSIKNTHGPREKAFMTRSAVATWILVALFVALQFVLADPYRHLLWIPYAIALPLGIRYLNRRQIMIRESEKAGTV